MMTRSGWVVGAALMALAGCSSPEPAKKEAAAPAKKAEKAPDVYQVKLDTSKGPVVIEVHRDWAPRGADHFYNLVQAGYYDSVYVHRVIPDGIAQFGFYKDQRINNVWLHKPIGDDPANGHSNKRGTVSFAQGGMNT